MALVTKFKLQGSERVGNGVVATGETVSRGTIAMINSDGYVEEIDGKYPDTKKLTDEFSSADVSIIGFNSEYMGLPHKLFKARGVTLEFNGALSMSKASFKMPSDMSDVEMYIMPMNV